MPQLLPFLVGFGQKKGKLEKDKKVFVKVTAKYRQIKKAEYTDTGSVKNTHLEVKYTTTTYSDKAMKKKIKSQTKTEITGTIPTW